MNKSEIVERKSKSGTQELRDSGTQGRMVEAICFRLSQSILLNRQEPSQNRSWV